MPVGDTNATKQDKWYNSFFKGGVLDVVRGKIQHSAASFAEYYGDLPAFSYNSGKEKKWIDFVMSWGVEKSQIQQVFLGNNAGQPLVPDMNFLPNADVPSDHIPVTVVLRFE